jgi:DNA invertase Pin-like site-specific DNA recombinase
MRGAAASNVLIVWRLDRLGRDLKHLIMTPDEMTALGVAFTSPNEVSTPGRPQDDSSCTYWRR